MQNSSSTDDWSTHPKYFPWKFDCFGPSSSSSLLGQLEVHCTTKKVTKDQLKRSSKLLEELSTTETLLLPPFAEREIFS